MTLRNFRQISEICQQGRLAEVLPSIPTDIWPSVVMERACLGKNVEAVKKILLSGVSVVPYYFKQAIYYDNLEILEMFILFKPNFNQWRFIDNGTAYEVLYYTLFKCHLSNGKIECLKLMIANGVRFNSGTFIPPGPIVDICRKFQCGVIACSDIIVVLIGLKKRKQILHKLDKFLIQQELAVAIWATRLTAENEKWSSY